MAVIREYGGPRLAETIVEQMAEQDTESPTDA